MKITEICKYFLSHLLQFNVKILIFLILIYRKCISPALGSNCRFYPSCSQYSIEALKKYGFTQGLSKSLIRLCKCHPFYKGGIDLP